MKYIVTKLIEVEADSPEDAVAKSAKDGKTISLSSQPARVMPTEQPSPPGRRPPGTPPVTSPQSHP